ncbi:hypothetical protein FOZ62_009221, partial [Perkinsus olseni]
MVDRLLLSRIHATSRECDTRNVSEIVSKLREKWPEYRRLKVPVITRVVQGEFPLPSKQPAPEPSSSTAAGGGGTPSSSEEEGSTKGGPDTTAMNDALDNMYLRQQQQQKQPEEATTEDATPTTERKSM